MPPRPAVYYSLLATRYFRNDRPGREPRWPARPTEWLDLVAKTFAKGGWLQDALNLEHRPQQERIAREVARSFSDDSVLLAEAGTGVDIGVR